MKKIYVATARCAAAAVVAAVVGWCSDERIREPVLHDASQIYCRYWGSASLPPFTSIIMRRASETSIFFLGFPREKKNFITGRTSIGCQKMKNKTLLCTRDVCVIQHRNWPLRSTILNAHGTNASPDGLCTRTHTNEAFSCWFGCDLFRVDRARRGNVCLEACLGRV